MVTRQGQTRDEELKALIDSQYRDMEDNDRQWPEGPVFTSLDKPIAFGNGDYFTLADVLDQDGDFCEP
jgi:hypothetical protein